MSVSVDDDEQEDDEGEVQVLAEREEDDDEDERDTDWRGPVSQKPTGRNGKVVPKTGRSLRPPKPNRPARTSAREHLQKQGAGVNAVAGDSMQVVDLFANSTQVRPAESSYVLARWLASMRGSHSTFHDSSDFALFYSAQKHMRCVSELLAVF